MRHNLKNMLAAALSFTVMAMSVSVEGRNFPSGVKNLQDLMANSTVLLETIKEDGGHRGTGFFYRFFKKDDPNYAMLVIMTNRHVLENAISVAFSVPIIENGVRLPWKKHDFIYPKERMKVEYHPDRSVDLCALIIEKDVDRIKDAGTNLCYFAFDNSFLARESDYQIERQLDPVVMVGHPNGLIDRATLQPIFRRGVYATRPELDYCGKKEFLLDIPNFGGSSGSPVFHFDEGQFQDRSYSGTSICIGSRLTLVGVSYAGNRSLAEGMVIQNGTNRTDLAVYSGVFNNTAYVIKASRIAELEDVINARYR